MIFPGEPRAWPDIDEWFWLHRRQVIGCILAVNLPFMISTYVIRKLPYSEMLVDFSVVTLLVGSMLIGMFSRGRRTVTVALVVLVTIHLSFIPLEILHRQGVW